jgi:hypothetical protein
MGEKTSEGFVLFLPLLNFVKSTWLKIPLFIFSYAAEISASWQQDCLPLNAPESCLSQPRAPPPWKSPSAIPDRDRKYPK